MEEREVSHELWEGGVSDREDSFSSINNGAQDEKL